MKRQSPSLKQSGHNILAPLPDGDWIVINPLAQNADVMSPAEARGLAEQEYKDVETLQGRGYVVDPEEEAKRFRRAYLDFIRRRDNEEIQLFFVPGYGCNFACDYCYQESYETNGGANIDVVDAFLAYVDTAFAGKQKYVTLFGGEPLLPGASRRATLSRLVEGLRQRHIDLAVVTNGYHLKSYLPVLTTAHIREIQITLDGVAKTHDARRPLHGGGRTFDRVVAAVNACLNAELNVNLRVVLDRNNLNGLVDLAAFAQHQGWTASPHFKTQLGRNYELHTCPAHPERLYSRLELYQALHGLYKEHPDLLDFHRPDFSVSRGLIESGTLPGPVFDACPGAKTEWAFDATGKIFACTATVGKPGEELGRFYPTVELNDDAVEQWESRDVLSIEACRNCPTQLICGGGCAAMARNRTGRLSETDCRPVPEMIALGVDLYRGHERTTNV
ncbi:MAG: hypothetical protein A2341_21520 [Deltaproteobacteria bacterium RIFOXYB12_FULL_58_9]|nr:MAG: hypothetical protein A2341_21520 [Deltaproteobacteria bacterium RIFOXYB12_FULL_58_9]